MKIGVSANICASATIYNYHTEGLKPQDLKQGLFFFIQH